MAGALRRLRPAMAPTGRTIRVRQLVGGDPTKGHLVEVQLGVREDRADFHPGFCLARRHGSFDQCARRAKRGFKVCGVHGGGHTVRVKDGTRLSPQEAGALSGLARRIKKDGKADLSTIPTYIPWLQARAQELRQQEKLVALEEDALTLTATRDLLLSGAVEMEPTDLIRALTSIVQAKSNVVRAKLATEGKHTVPIAKMRCYVEGMVGLFNRFVPPDRHEALLRELRLLAMHNGNQPGSSPGE